MVKNPDSRATASELLQHEFIQNAKSPEILNDMIREAQTTKEQIQNRASMVLDEVDSQAGTMVPGDSGTLVKGSDLDQGTMVEHPTLTKSDDQAEDSGSMIELESNLGTMVINEDEYEDTMQSN